MNQPNPRARQAPNKAQQTRSAIMRAVAAQQGVIEAQQGQINALTGGLASLVVAAGLDKTPQFRPLVAHARTAGLIRQADSAQNPDGAPATTTEEAAAPQATDDVESKGTAPAEVNKDVTPIGVTDVNKTDVVVNPPVLDNLQDVTQAVGGTDAVDPQADASHGETSQVEVTKPATDVMDPAGSTGWTNTSSRGTDTERFTASIRLARLQIEAGLEQGEDIALAQTIAASEQPLSEISNEVKVLSRLKAQAAQGAPRSLVPRPAAGGARQAPSMATQASLPPVTSTGRPDEDEFLVLGDGSGMYDLG